MKQAISQQELLGASVSCIRDLESCSASTVFQWISGLFSTCCCSLLFGLQSPQPLSNIGEQALQLCHSFCMVFRDVEIAIMTGLEHGHQSVKDSPEHWGIGHLHSHTVHSLRVRWVDLKYSVLFATSFHEMVGIYGPRHELEVDVASGKSLAHICRR